MESKDKFPDVWKFCVVCVAGSSCERPHCPSARDRPLDLSIKSDGFKRPSVLKVPRKRPTSLPLPGSMNARTAFILDRDKSVPSKPAHPYVKPDLPFLSGFGNPYPYGRVLATGYMRKDKQKIAER